MWKIQGGSKMKTDDFDFELPQQLIAQTPLIDRPSSRLMVLDKTKQTYTDKHFYQIVDYLKADDIIVRNNTRVIPARLFGTKRACDNNTKEDGHCEVLLLKNEGDDITSDSFEFTF